METNLSLTKTERFCDIYATLPSSTTPENDGSARQ
jgi:hypothetical protein